MTELPMDQIRTLLAAVDEGTFDAAATALHVTPSAVSQRVKALEQRVGRVLLTRTKPIEPTRSGRVLIRYARQLARLEADAAAELGLLDERAATTLAVAVNADSLATWFPPALARVPADLRIGFELHREDQERTATLLARGRVAAAVTNAPRPVTGCRVRPLGIMRYRASAAPAFAARHLAGRPLAEALPTAPVVVFDRDDDLQDSFLRTLTGTAAAKIQPRHHIPTSEAFLDAVASGLGWGMIPDEQAAMLPAGALVDLAPGRVVDVPLYWQRWKLDSPGLAALTDAVVEAARSLLQSADPPARPGAAEAREAE